MIKLKDILTEAPITDPRMNNPNPTKGIFLLKDRNGVKYTLVAYMKGRFVNYYKISDWDSTSGLPFEIDRLKSKLPKIKIDADKIIKAVESDLKGYKVHFYELL